MHVPIGIVASFMVLPAIAILREPGLGQLLEPRAEAHAYTFGAVLNPVETRQRWNVTTCGQYRSR
jgi:hypothetical protein